MAACRLDERTHDSCSAIDDELPEPVAALPLEDRIAALLKADPVAQGRCSPGVIRTIALEIGAEAQRLTDRIAPRGIDDVLAYLAGRRENAARVAQVHAHDEQGEAARDRGRQLDIVIDELRAGLHLGAAAVRAELAQPLSRQMESC